jgi:hypothetical protein
MMWVRGGQITWCDQAVKARAGLRGFSVVGRQLSALGQGQEPMYRGTHGEYFWLSSAEASLWELVSARPNLVVGQRVVVTAFDSGPLQLSSDELQAGWEQRGAIAVSPTIVDASTIPCDNYDEWYVFRSAIPEFESVELFVSYAGFSPTPITETGWDETWDRGSRSNFEALQDRFWSTVIALNCWAYMAAGNVLTLVTKSERDRDRVWDYLASQKKT